MSKIGKDILSFAPNKLTIFGGGKYSGNKTKILTLLRTVNRPMNISEISREAEIPWIYVKTLLYELLMEGKIEMFKSGKAQMFQLRSLRK